MNKDKKIIVRITEEQLHQLTNKLLLENKTKSIFLREIIEKELKNLS